MILGIICNRKSHEIDTLQSVNHTYLSAVERYMNVQPLLIPATTDAAHRLDAELVISRIDGLLITGNRSNVHPSHYEMAETPAHAPFDRQRDAASMALIQAALKHNLPMLAICRGAQELNVVCGGSLVPEVHKLAGRFDHRTPALPTNADDNSAANTIYAARHQVNFPENGYFHKLLGTQSAQSNSLHRQAIDRLGDGLCIEATAEDGTIEAISHIGSHYCVGVQWHPEMQTGENIISAALFGDFDHAIKTAT